MTDMTGHDMTCDAFAERLADFLEGDAPQAARDAMEMHAERCESCGTLLADLVRLPQEAAALPLLSPSRDLWSGIAERIDAPVLPLGAPRTARVVVTGRRSWTRTGLAAAALVVITAGLTHVLTRVSMTASPTIARTTAAPVQEVAHATIPSVAPVEDSSPAVIAEPRRVEHRQLAAHVSTPRVNEAPVRAATGTVRLARAEPLLHEAEPVYDKEIVELRRIVRERHSQLDPHTIAVLEQSVAVIDSAIAQSRAALRADPASGLLATQLNHSLEKKVELLRTAAMLPART